MRLLVEFVERHELGGQIDRLACGSGRKPRRRGLPEHGGGQTGHVAALSKEPCLERGIGADVDPLEELTAETPNANRLHPRG